MNVLFVNKFYYLRGGTERSFFETKKLLEDRKHRVIPFSMQDKRNESTPYGRYFVDNVEIIYDEVEIIDQSQLIQNDNLRYDHNDLIEKISVRIQATNADVLGFGTMCSSYPQTVILARECRKRMPGIPIIFGGPQASVVDVETLEHFPWIDIVVRGEAEMSIRHLILYFKSGFPLENAAGFTWRRGARICRTPDAPPVDDLDSQPAPAYHLFECRIGIGEFAILIAIDTVPLTL